jgi:hypothetical protein
MVVIEGESMRQVTWVVAADGPDPAAAISR